jgi:hypothetical protein
MSRGIDDVPVSSIANILEYLKEEERHYQSAALKDRPNHIWNDVANVKEWLDAYNSQEEEIE